MAKRKIRPNRKTAHKKAPRRAPKPAARPRKKKRAGSAAPIVAAGTPVRDRTVETLNWVHDITNKLVNSFPAEKATFQTGEADNHLLWNLGHLATSYSWFASVIDGQAADLPTTYNELFGYKSKPNGDPAAYPALDEVKAKYAAAYQRLVDAIMSQSDADLMLPTVTDTGGFAKTRLDVAERAAWHDGWHSGQISTLRRALGLPPMM